LNQERSGFLVLFFDGIERLIAGMDSSSVRSLEADLVRAVALAVNLLFGRKPSVRGSKNLSEAFAVETSFFLSKLLLESQIEAE